jgi:hypothetical protein
MILKQLRQDKSFQIVNSFAPIFNGKQAKGGITAHDNVFQLAAFFGKHLFLKIYTAEQRKLFSLRTACSAQHIQTLYRREKTASVRQASLGQSTNFRPPCISLMSFSRSSKPLYHWCRKR